MAADPKAEAKKEKEEKKEKEKEKEKEDAKTEKQKQADKEAAEEAKERAEAAAELLKSAAEQMKKRKPKDQKDDKKLDVTVIPDQTTATEPLAEEAEKGYDLLVIGLDKTTIRDNTGFHPNITQLAAGFDGPLTIVDARDGLLKNPPEAKLSILVPVNGTESSRRAAEVAIAMARASRAPITALYVTPPSQRQEQPAPPRRRHPQGHRGARRDLQRRGQDRGAVGKAARPGHPQGDGQAQAQPHRHGRRAPARREAVLRRHRDRDPGKIRPLDRVRGELTARYFRAAA